MERPFPLNREGPFQIFSRVFGDRFNANAIILMIVHATPLDLSVDLPLDDGRQGMYQNIHFFVIYHAVFIHLIIVNFM